MPSLTPAFERYNEQQLTTVKLPGADQEVGTLCNPVWTWLTGYQVVVSEFNKLEGNMYFDVESQTSFEVDHTTQVGYTPVIH